MTPVRRSLRRLRDRARSLALLAPIVRAADRLALRWVATERFDGRDPGERAYLDQYAAVLLPKTSGRVLDLGCGHGYLTWEIAARAEVSEVVGIDRIADFRCAHPKISYRTQDLTAKPHLPAGFDVVVATEFIEHISEAALLALLPFVRDALSEGGLFVGSTPPNPTTAETFSGSPFHRREYQPLALRALLSRHFADVEITSHGAAFMTWIARRPPSQSRSHERQGRTTP
ncbi:MAG: class I SAM-dependent methyltransferase [Armatimonadota bacterium]